MRTTFFTTAVVFTGLTAFTMPGCSEPQDTAPGTTAAKDSQTTEDTHDHGSGMAAMEDGLVEHSKADHASAMKQHVCPVSGEMLGTMGKPIIVSVSNQDVWVCCNGCTETLKADPEKYLAKLKSGTEDAAQEGHMDHSGQQDHGDHKDHAEGT